MKLSKRILSSIIMLVCTICMFFGTSSVVMAEENTTHDLTVENHVIGEDANTGDIFYFQVTVTEPAQETTTDAGTETVAPATVFDVVYSPETGAGRGDNPVQITAGQPVILSLRHGQSFTIKGLPQSATFVVEEQPPTPVTNYNGAATYTAGHTSATLGSYVAKAGIAVEGNNTSTLEDVDIDDNWIYTDIDDTTHEVNEPIPVVGSIATQVDVPQTGNMQTAVTAGTAEDVKIVYTNKKVFETPTGGGITYWPYILIVVACLVAAGVFVGLRIKRYQ